MRLLFKIAAMKILFVADPLESFKIQKDSTYAMMREAARRGHTLAACTPQDLRWLQGEGVSGFVRDITLRQDASGAYPRSGYAWFDAAQSAPNERAAALHTFDAVVMRKDPPFDAEYFYATHMLERAEAEGAKVFNKPRALRDHPEKLAILEFPQYTAPTLVTRGSFLILNTGPSTSLRWASAFLRSSASTTIERNFNIETFFFKL